MRGCVRVLYVRTEVVERRRTRSASDLEIMVLLMGQNLVERSEYSKDNARGSMSDVIVPEVGARRKSPFPV